MSCEFRIPQKVQEVEVDYHPHGIDVVTQQDFSDFSDKYDTFRIGHDKTLTTTILFAEPVDLETITSELKEIGIEVV